MKLFRTS